MFLIVSASFDIDITFCRHSSSMMLLSLTIRIYVLGAWRLMFSHTINDNIFEPFVDESDVLYKNTDNKSALLFSRLGKLMLSSKTFSICSII